jgi:hypothetical protein
MESHITEITRAIQLAVAPVFLLTAIATMISAMNTRLGRIVDRRRALQGRDGAGADPEIQAELAMLSRRSRLVYNAVFAVVLAALLVCLVVASAFMGALLSVDLARTVAGLFIAAMLAMIAGLGLFLREVFLAVRTGSHERR